jgi:opacity protein-like surface antigen
MVLFTVATWLNPSWGQPFEGSDMKRLLVLALLLGSVSAARAQVSAPTLQIDRGNAAQDFSAASAAKATLLTDLATADTFSPPTAKPANTFASPVVATALALPLENAEPASPSPRPKFLYGGREDYRWELGLEASWLRFRSTVFNASAVGINTSVVYFTNDWFGIEGNISAVFAPTILANEHVKIVTYGAGPKIARRQKQWEPWLHGIFGGAHEQPQISGQSRNTYVIKAGGGADYRWNPRVSLRLEGDYVRTGFFKQSQNNFQLAGGIVFHF